MARADDLQMLQDALTTVGRVLNSRRARLRIEEQAGVPLASTAIETLSAIRSLGPVRHGPVAARVGVQPSRISKEVRALVEMGMVTETPDRDDRRAVLLVVTDKGTDALTRYVDAAHEILAEVLDGWSPNDLAHLARLTARMASSFAADLLGSDSID